MVFIMIFYKFKVFLVVLQHTTVHTRYVDRYLGSCAFLFDHIQSTFLINNTL